MARKFYGWTWIGALALLVAVPGCGRKAGPSPALDRPATAGGDDRGAGQDGGAATGDASWGSQIQDVFFDFDRYDLRGDARSILAGNQRVLQANAGAQVTLEGHCDERGTEEYNLALGQRRADAVKAYLVDLGIPSTRLRTVSYGESKPFASGGDEAAWAENRRVHFDLP